MPPHSAAASAPRSRKAALRRGLRFLLVAACLLAIWLTLSGRFEPFYLTLGVIGSFAVAADTFPWRGGKPFPVLRFLSFVPWHLKQIVLSNLHVARLVLSPRLRIRPRFVRIAPAMRDERALTELGCAINLTPGTLTVEIDRETMLVHALDTESARDLTRHIMEDHVAKVFR